MTKENSSSQAPKAVNIIRPNTSYGSLLQNTTSTTSNSSGGSVGSYNSLPPAIVMHQQQKRNNSIHSTNSSLLSSSSATVRKPRVMSISHASEKPVLNIYHSPTKKPAFHNDEYTTSHSRGSSVVSNNGSNNRPAIEIYKPNQTRMTKSFTAPSLATTTEQQQQPLANKPVRPAHRSVLGPINTPVAASNTLHHPTAATTNIISPIIEKTQAQLHLHQENVIENHLLDKSTTTTTSESEVEEEEEEGVDLSEEDEGSEIQEDSAEDDEEEEEEEPVINEARVNRKIADLELSINSLLTVNAMLEATVRKQASQLNQMKNKMLSGESVDSILSVTDHSNDILNHELELNDQDSDDEKEDENWDQDVVFQRLRKITEFMIEQGQKSIDYEYKILGRVLSNYKPEEDEDEDEDNEEEEVEEEDKDIIDGEAEIEEKEDTLSRESNNITATTTNTSSIPQQKSSSLQPNNIPSSTNTITTTNKPMSRVARLSRRK